MKHIRAIISILVMLLVVILVVENLGELSKTLTFKINLMFWSYESPQMSFYFVMIIVFLLGILIASLFGMLERFKLKKKTKKLAKESREMEKELNSLRNLPIVEKEVGNGTQNDEGRNDV